MISEFFERLFKFVLKKYLRIKQNNRNLKHLYRDRAERGGWGLGVGGWGLGVGGWGLGAGGLGFGVLGFSFWFRVLGLGLGLMGVGLMV